MQIDIYLLTITSLTAVTLLSGWQEWHPACKNITLATPKVSTEKLA